jgi:hypothetical protein
MREHQDEGKSTTMPHRHLIHQDLTPAAIDDVIARGRRRDWGELRLAVLADRTLMVKVLEICRAVDLYAQRYHLWMLYAEQHLS